MKEHSDLLALSHRIQDALQVKVPKNLTFSRIGSKHDGGYVVVDDFLPTDYLLSFGVADNVDFENVMSRIVSGIDMYDFSVASLPRHVNKSRFFMEKVTSNHQHIFDRVAEHKDLILKIDIEGSEWDFFDAISDGNISRLKQIVLEIHWMIDNEHISVPECRIDIIEKINKTHQIVALHPNNWSGTADIAGLIVPRVLEITFLRRLDYSFIDGTPPKELFFPCNPDIPEIDTYLQEVEV